MSDKYRLITRSDFDGLVCAILLEELGMIDDILFVHPKDMQDGKIEVSHRDISANLPYVPGIHMAFDHHVSETLRNPGEIDNHVIEAGAPSAARVVYNHFGGRSRFPGISEEMMAAVDKGDAAQFSIPEILDPRGWVLLNFLMDARTGLGRFREFKVSNHQLMRDLIAYCRNHTVDEVLELPDVRERVELYREHSEKAKEQIARCTRVHRNLAVLDLRQEPTIFATNRFTIYALYPETNISIHVLWGRGNENVVLATGKSIINRTSRTNIGALMLEYGGGGHDGAGTCQVAPEQADQVLEALIARINRDG